MAEKQSLLLSTLLSQIAYNETSNEVLAGAWHLAVRAKDVDAMAQIAAANDLPDEVLAAVKARNEIPVAVSYLTRPGLDVEERRARFVAENRAGVLAGVLASNKLTAEDQEIIGAKLIAKPTRALSEAVITSGSMPLAAVVVAVGQLESKTDSLTDQMRSDLRRQIIRLAGDPVAAKAATKVINDANLAEILLAAHPELDDETFSEFFTNLFEPRLVPLTQKNNNTTYYVTRLLRNIIGREGEYHAPEVLASLKRVFEEDFVAKVWTELVGATRAAADTSDTSDYSQTIITAGTTDDVELLGNLCAIAINSTPAMFDPLLRNPNLTFELVKLLSEHVDERYLARALAAHKGDEQMALMIYNKIFEVAVELDKWESFPDKERGKKLVLDHHINVWYERQSSYYSTETRLLCSILEHFSTEEIYDALPWEFVRSMINARYNDARWSRIMTGIQSRVLGKDLKKWETAEVLAQSFSGTVSELVQAASVL